MFELNVVLGGDSSFKDLKFGCCSVFDVCIEPGDDLHHMPFHLPVKRYAEEMLIGLRGSPHNEAEEKRVGAKVRANWQILKRILETEPVHDACDALFWIMMGVVMKRVCEEAIQEYRENLAKAWSLVTLEVRKIASEGPKGTESETQEWLLRYLPVVLVQCIYRLLVDAFGQDKPQLTHWSEQILEKIARVVTYEVSGFKLNKSTLLKERKHIFQKVIITNPYVNQHECLKSQMRREFLENRSNKEPMALIFGQQDALPLEEEQLEHVMLNRSISQQKGTEAGGIASTMAFECVPSELSVDRYSSIAQIGDQLMQRQLDELHPADAAQTIRPGSAQMEEDGVCIDEELLRNSFANAGSTGKSTIRNRREAEQAEKRRREDLLQTLILDAPMPAKLCERSFDTAWVSPITDRLVPSEHDRQGLNKRSADSRRIRMEMPVRLEGLLKSRSEPLLRKSVKLPKISDGIDHLPALPHPQQEKKATRHHTDMVMEPPASLKSAVVINRLEEHLVQFNSKSFGNYAKEVDISSGHQKQRMDPGALRKAENSYVSSLHALVGPAREPALTMLNSPERKAKRRGLVIKV
jgi:hypothetical protein